ncbi:MAG: DUF2946 domain-containing protein [Rhodanobacter sp.]
MMAMLLVAVMPVVSRCLPLHAGMSGMGAGSMSSMQDAHHHAHGTPGDPSDPTTKCGFCTLLAHTPLVALDLGVTLPPASGPALSPSTLTFRHASVAPLLSAQPRGPPRIG